MSQILSFAAASPWLAFGLSALAVYVLCLPFGFAFRCWNRYLRSRNIAARGWPPEHLDADGDPREPDRIEVRQDPGTRTRHA
jgi:hypothetical protein